MENYIVEIRLDKRYKNKEGKYPAKLWVYASGVSKQKRYSIGSIYTFTDEEWETSLKAKRGELKELREEMDVIKGKAKKIINGLSHFDFEEFEKIMFGGKKAQKTINHFYEAKIEECKKSNRFGTKVNYESSLKSLQAFAKKEIIFFDDITSNWLKKYEYWMVEGEGEGEGKSPTTVGIYLRPLRALFNDAKMKGVIKEASYPFGKGGYQIRAPRARKNALSLDELKAFYRAEPETPEQEKAKDFWFFSFYCNGMNIKDIVFLRWGNIEGDKLYFTRSKTANTKDESREITIFLNDRAKEIIEKYGTKNRNQKNFLFPILKIGSTDIELERQKNNFTRFVNQHLKKLFKSAGINRSISHGVGRHSFANFALNNNVSLEHISEALGHSSTGTTQIYLSGFDDGAKKDLSNKLNLEL